MQTTNNKIVVAISGASGSIYAKQLLDSLQNIPNQYQAVGVIMTNNAKQVWETELQNDSYKNYPFTFYEKNNFNAPFASGSANYNIMIAVPCSMGMLGRIANGISDDLITRAADVVLKEKRKLILAIRETPYNLIHIKNMETVSLAGGIICPCTPSFYSQPTTIEEACYTVTNRILSLAGLHVDSYSWGE